MLTRLRIEVRRRYPAAAWMVAAAAFLLLYVRDLGEKSLWIDEYLTLDFAARDLGGVLKAAAEDVHPPAYFLLLHFWLRLFGQSDIALRLPSAIFSAASLVLLYLLGKKVHGRRVAAAAVCFALASPFYLLFSHMARYYAMTLAVSLFSTLVLLLAVERGRLAYWISYGLACSLVLYTDYPAAAVIGAHGVFLVGRWLARRLAGWQYEGEQQVMKSWLIAAIVCLMLYLPWLGIAIGRAMLGSQGRASDYAQSLAGIVLKLGAFFYSFSVGETLFPWHPLALLGLMAALASLFFGPRTGHAPPAGDEGVPSRRRAGFPLLIVALLGLSLVSTVFITTVVTPLVTFLNVGSRTMFAFPYFALLVAAGLVRMRRWAWPAVALIAAANLLGYANYVNGQSFLNPIYTVPSKQIAADLGQRVQPGDVVISTVDSVFERYYDRDKAATAPHFLASAWDEARSHAERNQTKRIWFLTLGLDTNRDTYPAEVADWLRSRYVQTELKGYAEQDPVYRSIKERLLKREAYRYKAMLALYEAK